MIIRRVALGAMRTGKTGKSLGYSRIARVRAGEARLVNDTVHLNREIYLKA